MSASDERGPPALLHRQYLLAQFGAFALRGEVAQALLEEACRTAGAAWGGPAAVWQYVPATGQFHLGAAIRWPADDKDAPQARSDLAGILENGPLAGNEGARRATVHPAPWLREQGLQHAVGAVVRGGQTAFGFLEVGVPDSLIAVDDATFLESLASLLGLALERATERDQLREALAARDDQLREKDLTVQEVHHRIRNSLQLVHTLLTLQVRSLRSPEARHQLEAAATRIMTIGTVHQRLYQGAPVAESGIADYLHRLLDDLSTFTDHDVDRSIEIIAPAMTLPTDKITPLGLITVELVTNALKYGKGTIRVTVKPRDDAIDIAVEDEGPGFPQDFSPLRTSGLGMRIVSALSKAGRDAIRVDRSVPHARIVARLLLEGPQAATA